LPSNGRPLEEEEDILKAYIFLAASRKITRIGKRYFHTSLTEKDKGIAGFVTLAIRSLKNTRMRKLCQITIGI
jgi:hypothetical protein